MPKTAKVPISVAFCVALWADIVFITWATQFNLLIVVPTALSAAYLSYAAVYWSRHS